jgi:hypothetical protein
MSLRSGAALVTPRTDCVALLRRHPAVLSLLTMAAFALAPVVANAQVGPTELSGADFVQVGPTELSGADFA